MEILKKFFISVFTAVIVEVVASIIVSLISNINLIDATIIIWKWIYNFIKSLLLFRVPIWVILIVIVFFIIIIMFIYNYSNSNNCSKPWYSDYIEDEYKNILYTWNYTTTYSGKIDIENFRPICPSCEGDLTTVWEHGNRHYSGPRLFCPNCDNVLNTPSSEEIDQAKLFVFNKLKKKLNDLQKEDKEN